MTSKKPVVAIDMDEVLFPMMEQFLAFHNVEFGTTLKKEDMHTYHAHEITGETEEAMLARIPAYIKSEHYAAGRPVPGSVEALQKLSEQYYLVVITYRAKEYRGSTEAYIQKYYPGLIQALHYTHFLDLPDKTVSKYEIAQGLQAVAIIDDSLSTVSDCAVHGIQGIVFGDFPWNQAAELPAGVTRCKDWQAVLEYFDGKR